MTLDAAFKKIETATPGEATCRKFRADLIFTAVALYNERDGCLPKAEAWHQDLKIEQKPPDWAVRKVGRICAYSERSLTDDEEALYFRVSLRWRRCRMQSAKLKELGCTLNLSAPPEWRKVDHSRAVCLGPEVLEPFLVEARKACQELRCSRMEIYLCWKARGFEGLRELANLIFQHMFDVRLDQIEQQLEGANSHLMLISRTKT
jgi:hypothetical protein